ncbi:MAG: hypothetical protein HYV06_09665 [Deltaproteobacteria bacterium]|nr:hypothetical protein [Deltaproteobacteria bacterium]
MKELRATFYELRSYFVPGSMVLWAVLELMVLTGYEPSTGALSSLSQSVRGVLFIVIAYVIGHGLHVVANYTIDKMSFSSYPPKDYFDAKFEQDFSPEAIASLFKATAAILGIQNPDAANAKETIKKAYWVCLQYVMNLQNVETENFLGLTGFYRGITAAMAVISGMYLLSSVYYSKGVLGIIGLCSFLAGLMFLTRVRRFGYYLVRTVYFNFLHLYNQKNSGTTSS